MERIILGKTGLSVSRLGLGGIPVQRINPDETRELMRFLSDNGVNFLDSARGYTISEGYLGDALQHENLREKFIIATKSMSRGYEAMQADIETSLNNFHTNHIELYQMHNLKTQADFDLAFSDKGCVAALKDAQKRGQIGHIGATAHSEEALMKLLDHDEIETVMFPYNIVESQGLAAMKKAKQRNVAFIAMKPLAGGNITDGRLALRYCLANDLCTIAIPGMASIDEAQTNISAANDTFALTGDELAEIEKIRSSLSGDFCRRCGYCAPCSEGIDIPSCFLMQAYLENYNLSDWAKARYASMKSKASACIKCGKCEIRCPYDLPIRQKLQKVAELFGE